MRQIAGTQPLVEVENMQMIPPPGQPAIVGLSTRNRRTKKAICKGCPGKKVARPKRDQTKKADLQRGLDKNVELCPLANWFKSTTLADFLEEHAIFRLFSTSFWIAQLVLFPRNLFHQKCTGPHWGGHQVKRPARRMPERRKGKNFTTWLDFIIGNQITSSWLCVWGERVNKSHKII